MELAHKDAAFQFTAAKETAASVCPRCGKAVQSPQRGSMAFWRGSALFVIEDIPVMVCDGCHAEILDDAILLRLNRMRSEGLTADRMVEALLVPVFRFPVGSGD